jgi:hypothetical protein
VSALGLVQLAAAVWTTLAPGLDFGEFPTGDVAGESDTAITILRIDPGSWSLHLGASARDTDGQTMTAREWCADQGYVAAINAGMFHVDYSAHVGYLRDADYVNSDTFIEYQSVAAWNPTHDDDTAFRMFDLDAPGVTTDEILARYGTVVQNLRLIKRPGENRWSRKDQKWSEAALAEDAEGRVLFVFSRVPFTMEAFNERLLDLDIGIVSAQHLEGGPEAQLYIGLGDRERVGSYETGFNETDHNVGAWAIPNVIGVRARVAGDK